MKKLISLILALVMVMGLATTAFAADTNTETLDKDNDYTTDIAVNGKYIDELLSDEIISVDVKWDAMDFTYAATQQGTWNPQTHEYDDSTEEAAWVNTTTSDITVTNHSNVDVTASFEFKNTGAEGNNASGTFTKDSVDLDAGVVNDYDHADSEKVTFTIGGSLTDAYKEQAKIGTITVSVVKKQATSSEPEAATYTLRAGGDSIFYWSMNGTVAKGDIDWNKVKFLVTDSDGNTTTLEYSQVIVTQNFDGEMDLSMKPLEE